MTNPTVSDYLKYANLQMAAEAFLKDELTGEERYSGGNLITALTAGNKRSLKFTRLQAEAFAAQWTVVDQKANSSTGFSGTLFRSNKDNEALGIRKDELVLSFRSTEFIDDHARDNKATNDLEIDGTGFALGQIADMEAWYARLAAPNGALAGKTYSVTGYSLGGHLATVFNQLRQAELQAGPPPARRDQVITFNGAGVGEIRNGTVTALVNRFVQLRDMAAGADGLAGLFQTATGKQAYHALRAALAVNLGVPTAAMKDAVANVFGALNEGDTLLQADRNVLLGANGALISDEPPTGTPDGVLFNDLIQGLGGNDSIVTLYGGNDRILGGPDDDWLFGTDGNDVVIGGTERDVLVEGAGNDRLYADEMQTVGAALKRQNDPASNAQGEALSAGPGNDLTIGGSGNDLLFGGLGSDLLIGGAGDDTIDGDINANNILEAWRIVRTATADDTALGGVRRLVDFREMSIDWPTAGGDDVIYAGAGDDWVTASYGNAANLFIDDHSCVRGMMTLKSRCWRHGDFRAAAINDHIGRNAA